MYDFGTVIGGPTDPRSTYNRGPMGRGWVPSNDPFHPSIARVPGLVRKFAVTGSALAVLSEPRGPLLLMDYSNPYWEGPFYMNGMGTAGSPRSERTPREIAFHPLTGNLLALEGTNVNTYFKDETVWTAQGVRTGRVNSRVMGLRPVSMVVDPDPNPTMLLVADQGGGRINVGRLDSLSFGYNERTDYISNVVGCPIDVTMRPADPPVVTEPNPPAKN